VRDIPNFFAMPLGLNENECSRRIDETNDVVVDEDGDTTMKDDHDHDDHHDDDHGKIIVSNKNITKKEQAQTSFINRRAK